MRHGLAGCLGDQEFDAATLAQGFVREHRAGRLLIRYYHPDHPNYGFQQVSRRLFDGLADRDRLVRLTVDLPAEITLPAIEDMIADRLGQYAATAGSDDSRLRQTRLLYRLAERLDGADMVRRIVEEGGDPAWLKFYKKKERQA